MLKLTITGNIVMADIQFSSFLTTIVTLWYNIGVLSCTGELLL